MGHRTGWRSAGGALTVAAAVLVGATLAATAPSAAAPAAPWTPATAAPSPIHGTWAGTKIDSVSCPSPGSCVAVGRSTTTYGLTPTTNFTYEGPVVEVYSAGHWSSVAVPYPPNATTGAHAYFELRSVSCPAPGWCVAAGFYELTTGRDRVATETLANGTWTAAQAPIPTGHGTKLTDSEGTVSCPQVGWCALGSTLIDRTAHASFIAVDTLANGTWSATTLPSLSGVGSVYGPNGLSCAAPGSCALTASYYTFTTAINVGALAQLAGTSWSVEAAPKGPGEVSGGVQYVDGVSCAAPGSCVAVGHYPVGTHETVGLIETLSGTTWTAARAPVPAGFDTGTVPAVTLSSVSCPAVGVCQAVGSDLLQSGGYSVFAIGQGASGWTPEAIALPPNHASGGKQDAYLTQVSCAAPGVCAAGGFYGIPGETNVGLLATLSGSTWTTSAAPVPTPSGTTPGGSEINAVSCVAGGCAAGGDYARVKNTSQGLLETTGTVPTGYYEFATDGGIFAFTAPFHGSTGNLTLNAPVVAGATDPLTGGYYEVASDGGMFAFTAPYHGSMGGKPLNEPIVGMAFDTRTGGYYEVAADGGIFAFTAPFHGSMGGKPLNEPIVGIAFDPTTGGYYEVASDGGLFAFTAPFLGSMGGKPLNEPIVAMTWDSLTGGYYEVASDGGLFAFTAPFLGSMGGKPLNKPVVGMSFDWGTGGYWEVASDGGLFAFTAPFLGSMGGKPLNKPIVDMAAA